MYVSLQDNGLHKLYFVIVFSGPTILLMFGDNSSPHKDIVKVIKTVSDLFYNNYWCWVREA